MRNSSIRNSTKIWQKNKKHGEISKNSARIVLDYCLKQNVRYKRDLKFRQ